jgi:hypothetical protein
MQYSMGFAIEDLLWVDPIPILIPRALCNSFIPATGIVHYHVTLTTIVDDFNSISLKYLMICWLLFVVDLNTDSSSIISKL